MDVRRRAGVSATKPFTRSSIKPRLLFPSEEQRHAREEAEEADEEAVTDIEMPKPADAVTPTKLRHFHLTTPPTSVRSRRTAPKEPAEELVPGNVAHLGDDLVQSPGSSASQVKAKKRSPFAGFQRKKATSGTPKNSKREGSPMAGESAKRTRS